MISFPRKSFDFLSRSVVTIGEAFPGHTPFLDRCHCKSQTGAQPHQRSAESLGNDNYLHKVCLHDWHHDDLLAASSPIHERSKGKNHSAAPFVPATQDVLPGYAAHGGG